MTNGISVQRRLTVRIGKENAATAQVCFISLSSTGNKQRVQIYKVIHRNIDTVYGKTLRKPECLSQLFSSFLQAAAGNVPLFCGRGGNFKPL